MKSIFKEAQRIFVNVMEYHQYKFKYLPESVLFKAKQFYKEAQGKNTKFFPKFKRGTIVYVKFGVNIGSELSGNHFAIVLDKYDKVTKSTITVVPLSSKRNKYYQELIPYDNIYFKNSKYHLNKIDELISKWEVKSKEYISEINDLRPDYLNDLKNYTTKLLIANNGIMTDDIQKNINNYSEELITKALYKLNKGNKVYLESKEQHFKGIEKYKNKDSYACVNMIQTIDKRKLTPVSEFESAGNITISEESMNLIENRIRKIYFNI
ncbi:MAG: type II toxin-antitoxin system PemK/MazF family toxin [Gemella haemolysans]|nr:type II toxin-antitoxin system PemK/MazF family toxin [Gemella haemolysans]